MFSGRLWELFIDSFPKILIPGLTVTIPLTVISFTFALIIAVIMALVQFANLDLPRHTAACAVVCCVLRPFPHRHFARSVSGGSYRVLPE